MKRIIVTLNYNNNKQIALDVPEQWSDGEITKAVNKKYGEIDIKKWEIQE